MDPMINEGRQVSLAGLPDREGPHRIPHLSWELTAEELTDHERCELTKSIIDLKDVNISTMDWVHRST